LDREWVGQTALVCLGRAAGTRFPHFFIRANMFGRICVVVEWVGPLEMR
jgi:hypothetical protein